MGAAVILDRKLPMTAIAPAVAAAGLAIGLDSAPDVSTDREMALAFAGLVFGFLGVATVITGLAIGLTRDWQRIGVRIAGSWIVAVSILVLVLSIAAHLKHLPTAAALASGRSSPC